MNEFPHGGKQDENPKGTGCRPCPERVIEDSCGDQVEGEIEYATLSDHLETSAKAP